MRSAGSHDATTEVSALCQKYYPNNPAEPLKPHIYPEVCKINDTTTDSVITCMRSIYSRYDIPNKVFSDNGPQFVSERLRAFGRKWDTYTQLLAHISLNLMDLWRNQ